MGIKFGILAPSRASGVYRWARGVIGKYSGIEGYLRQHASDRIVLLDYVSGVSFDEVLTNAMLFVLPSDLEGLSLALLEAMGAGLCVLVSDIPENLELVDGAGFTFKRGDVADLTRMLRLLLHADILRADAGCAARKRVEERYLWPMIAEENRSRRSGDAWL